MCVPAMAREHLKVRTLLFATMWRKNVRQKKLLVRRLMASKLVAKVFCCSFLVDEDESDRSE